MDFRHLNDIGIKPVSKPLCQLYGKEVAVKATGSTAAPSSSSMKLATGNEVRQKFIDFFTQRAHTFVKSANVIPYNDTTLLFINAGMNQFKPVFTGQIEKEHPWYTMKAAANSQKCIRAGGKHNDLDDVGFDTYHHTFFEMLGNWSFGDYFKKEAIDFAWELLTTEYKLDPDRLYVTYFGGVEGDAHLQPDLEARDLWRKYLTDDRILPFGMKDNFWEMGDTGPCGPCSEIHYDRIGGRDASSLVNEDHPDVLEIWNIVFMQFNREADRSLKPLRAKSIDTGMGLERLLSVLNDVPSNYDTDLFTGIFEKIHELTKQRKYTGKVGKEDVDGVDMAYRVVADHVRTLTIALSDGARPGPDGNGYVLRRILRRAVRYSHDFLAKDRSILPQLVDVVVDILGDAFPEVREKINDVKRLIIDEEKQFKKTLEKGLKQFEEFRKKTPAGGKLSGEDTFQLYTTFGFPVDLTVLMAKEKNCEVDTEGFEALMIKFRNDSKKAAGGANVQDLSLHEDQTHILKHVKKCEQTRDALKYEWNSDGSGKVVDGVCVAIWNGKEFVEECSDGRVGLIFDQTPVYAEGGGQIYDSATVVSGNMSFAVENCQKYAGYVVHMGEVKSGKVEVGQTCQISVDFTRRALVANNHTATHILNFALRRVLGPDVDQKGSLVDEDKLRFDFTWGEAVDLEKLREVERICNEQITREFEVHAQECELNEAMAINGLRAVFGEKYSDKVRVISVGQDIPTMLKDRDTSFGTQYSVEFCGGTHVRNTQQLHKFVITVEEGIAKGIRRIVACTGPRAAEQSVLRLIRIPTNAKLADITKTRKLLDDLLKIDTSNKENNSVMIEEIGAVDVRDVAVMSLTEKREKLQQLDVLKDELLKEAKANLKKREQEAKRMGNECTLTDDGLHVEVFDGLEGDPKMLKFVNDALEKRYPRSALFLVCPGDDRCALKITVPKNWSDRIIAKDWLEHVLATFRSITDGKPDANGNGDANKAMGEIKKKVSAEQVKQAAESFAKGI